MPSKTTGLRELTERVVAASCGDSLGLRYDLETQLEVTESIVEEFSRSLDPAQLEQWRLLVENIEQSFDLSAQSPELRARVQTHRLMLDTASKLMTLRQSGADPAGEIMMVGR
jgi:hypothetical protein